MDILAFFQLHPEYLLIVVGLISLFIGSFLNVVIYRLPIMLEHQLSEECRHYLGLKPQAEPEKLNLSLPMSHCPRCKKTIAPWHNIPVLSYFWLKGSCAHCKARISMRYPLVEALTCFVSVYVTLKFGQSLQCLALLLYSWIAIALFFIDLDHHMLPDELTLLLLWVGLYFSIFNVFCDSADAIIGAIVGYSIFALIKICFEWILGKDALGQGDLKFFPAIACFTGWQLLPLIMLLSSLIGIIFTFTHMIMQRKLKFGVPLPFGPYLAVGGWLTIIWGHDLMKLFLHYPY